MRLCLAGTFPAEKIVKEYRPEYVLESFFYIRPWQIEEIPKWKMFLLDSGAFTFMHGIEASSKPVDWDGYLSRYIDFINRNNVQHFFELDVDSIVGYDAVKRMRARLELVQTTGAVPDRNALLSCLCFKARSHAFYSVITYDGIHIQLEEMLHVVAVDKVDVPTQVSIPIYWL